MKKKRHISSGKGMHTLALLLMLIFTCSCSKVPQKVIQPDDMADLLTDIYISDAMVEFDYSTYGTEENRLKLRQSVLDKHGVTSAELDTSLGWYGRNLEIYKDVEDKVLKNLETRLGQMSDISAAAGFYTGDSVDVWSKDRHYRVSPDKKLRLLSFSLETDSTCKTGDSYTWRTKMINASDKSTWKLGVLYEDGDIEYISKPATMEGWNEMDLITDSTKTAKSIFGTLIIPSDRNSALWLDSMELVRKRLNPIFYTRKYNQRTGFSPKETPEDKDSLSDSN